MLGAHNDISQLKETELKLKESQDFSELMLDASEDIIFVKDQDFRIVKANKAFLELYPKNMQKNIIGSTTIEKYNTKDAELFLEHDKIAFDRGSSRVLEYIKMPNGQNKAIDTYKVRFYDKDNNPFILGIARDVSERENLLNEIKHTNKILKHIAYNDDLTGLLNRKGFIRNASKAIDNHHSLSALFIVDLDDFKFINDSLGYNAGDELIIKISQRLQRFLKSDTIIGRSSGDDFLIFLQNITDYKEFEKLHRI